MDTSEKDSRHIAALTERLGRLIDADAHGSGLAPVHWEVLRYLNRANRFSRSPAALTSFLGSTKGTVSQTVKTLEGKGWVRTRIDVQDRRRHKLSLTAKGMRLLANDPLAEMTAAIGELSPGTRASLAAALEEVLRLRLQAGGRRPFGQCRRCRHFADTHPKGKPHYCMLLKERLSKRDAKAICHEQVAASE